MMRLCAAMTLAVLLPTSAHARDREIASAFFVSKTENRNQVHYAVRVDEACRLATAVPVRAYWLMLEKGRGVTEPLLEREQPAYGLLYQRLEGSALRVAIRSLPSREIVIQTWQAPEGQCLSSAITTIAGVRARLFNVHVVISALGLGISSIMLTGWRDDGSLVREQIKR